MLQEFRMPVQEMNCPKCGHRAAEYDANKWQCLHCGSKFIYEPPPKPDRLIRKEVVVRGDESSHYICSACGGRIPRLTCPEYTCRWCKKSVCKDCMEDCGYCTRCLGRIALWFIGGIAFILFILIGVPLLELLLG